MSKRKWCRGLSIALCLACLLGPRLSGQEEPADVRAGLARTFSAALDDGVPEPVRDSAVGVLWLLLRSEDEAVRAVLEEELLQAERLDGLVAHEASGAAGAGLAGELLAHLERRSGPGGRAVAVALEGEVWTGEPAVEEGTAWLALAGEPEATYADYWISGDPCVAGVSFYAPLPIGGRELGRLVTSRAGDEVRARVERAAGETLWVRLDGAEGCETLSLSLERRQPAPRLPDVLRDAGTYSLTLDGETTAALDVRRGTEYVLETVNLDEEQDPTLTLRSPGGATILHDDDSGEEYHASRLVWRAPADGRVDLVVGRYTEVGGPLDLRFEMAAGDGEPTALPDQPSAALDLGAPGDVATVASPGTATGYAKFAAEEGCLYVGRVAGSLLVEPLAGGMLTAVPFDGELAEMVPVPRWLATAGGDAVVQVVEGMPDGLCEAEPPWCGVTSTLAVERTAEDCAIPAGAVPAADPAAAPPVEAPFAAVDLPGDGAPRYLAFAGREQGSLWAVCSAPDCAVEVLAEGEAAGDAAAAGPTVFERFAATGTHHLAVHAREPGRLWVRHEVPFDGLEVGSCVVLGEHEVIDGEQNWDPGMAEFVGRTTTIEELVGPEPNGSFVVKVAVDEGAWYWRTRHMSPGTDCPPAP